MVLLPSQLLIFLWILGNTICWIPSAPQADNLGEEFIIVFNKNTVETPTEIPLELYITTPITVRVNVKITTPKYNGPATDITFTVISGEVKRVELNFNLRMIFTGIEGKVVYIQADNEIAVYGVNKEQWSTDGFLVFPQDVIGYEYYVVSHSPASSFTQFAVAARFDATVVTIAFPKSQGQIPLRVEYQNVRYTNGDILNVTLQAFEAFQCVSYDSADLTGTHLVSNLPVAVFSGNDRTWVGEGISRDHIVVQLPPVEAFDNEYAIIPVPGRTIGDYVRVISSKPNTTIAVEGRLAKSYKLLNSGDYVSLLVPSDEATHISSDQPVLVVQIIQSQLSRSKPGDPTMLLAVGTSQYLSSYMFGTPGYSRGGSYENWLVCVASYFDIHGLMLDNAPLANRSPQWLAVPGTDLVATRVPINDGVHSLRHISRVTTFGGYVYGVADRESYSFQLGQRLSTITNPCMPQPQKFGDGIDNDCDGRIDEEICYGQYVGADTDDDGLIDEDCSFARDVYADPVGNGGRQFVIAFMENTVELPLYLPLEVYVTPLRSGANVRIESPLWMEPAIRQDAQVSFGAVMRFDIPYILRQRGTELSTKALFVSSDSDIAVFGVNRELHSTDGFLAIPVEKLGTRYYGVTYWPNSESSLCQIALVGVQDGTAVNITFPPASERGVVEVVFNGKMYTNDDTLSVSLNRFSTLQIQSTGDLTGSYITASHKVAVYSGNIHTSVGSGVTRDHLVVMLPPVDSWGQMFCTTPVPGRTASSLFYLLASEKNTRVEVINKFNFTLGQGEVRIFSLSSTDYVAVKADKPVLIVQVSQSQLKASELGDATFLVLLAHEHWANYFSFTTATLASSSATAARDSPEDFQSYLSIIAPTARISELILDGSYMPSLFAAWFPISGTEFSGTYFAIQDGGHTLQHNDPSVKISALVYNNGDRESFGFPAGQILPSTANISLPTDSATSNL